MKFTPSTKYKIQDIDEMQLFMHVKRRGASATKNKKAYARHSKHKGRRYDYQILTHITNDRRPFADVFTQSLIGTLVSLAANGHFAIVLWFVPQ